MVKQCMLTTIDNPFNPFNDFTSWFLFDIEKKHNCCGLVDRIAKYDDNMTEEEVKIETERAIDEIIFYDDLHIYKKIVMEVDETSAETDE